MTLKNALTYFNNLVSETGKKSEIKIYQEFIELINSLENRDLSASEIQSIERELEELDLPSGTSGDKKYFDKALQRFKKFLRGSFSLTTKGYYANTGIALGMLFGILFGIVFLSGMERSTGISMGIAFGMLIGLLIGRNRDAQAESSGRVV